MKYLFEIRLSRIEDDKAVLAYHGFARGEEYTSVEFAVGQHMVEDEFETRMLCGFEVIPHWHREERRP